MNPRRGMTPRSDVYTVCNTHKQGRGCGGVSPRCAMQLLEGIVPRSAAARCLEGNVYPEGNDPALRVRRVGVA